MPEPLTEVLGVAACLLLKNLAWYSVSKRKKTQVAQVEQIIIYPVKSCRGVHLSEAEITESGIRYKGVRDRSYVIYSAADKRNVSLKNFTPLSEVQPQLDADRPGAILLTAEGHPSIPVRHTNSSVALNFRTEKVTALDCGNEVSAWLERVCDKPGLRLAYTPDALRDTITEIRKVEKIGGMYSAYSSIAESPTNHFAFADKTPIMLLSSASLKKLNEQLDSSHGGTDWRNFRPNIVTSATEDGDEDSWGFIYGDTFVLVGAFPCQRCPMVNIDHTQPKATVPTGEPVIRSLRPYRCQPAFKNPLFGVCCVVHTQGKVRVGEALFADK